MPSYTAQVLADGALSLWTLGDAGPTNAADLGPANQTGTYNNGPTFGVPGLIGGGGINATNFTAVSTSWMQAPCVAGTNYTTDLFTLEFWVKRNGTGFNATYFSQRHGSVGATGGPAILTNAVNNLIFGGSGGAFTIGTSTQTISDTTTYHHVVWSKNAAANKMYLDGVDITPTITNTAFTGVTAGSLWVVDADGGSVLPASTGDFRITMVAVYGSVLPANAVLTHFQIGTNTFSGGGSGGGAFNNTFGGDFQPASGLETFEPFDSPQGFVRRRSGLHVPRPRRVIRPAERRVRVPA